MKAGLALCAILGVLSGGALFAWQWCEGRLLLRAQRRS